MLPGIQELASDVFDRPVRIGTVTGVSDLRCTAEDAPRYAEVAGILRAGVRDSGVQEALDVEREPDRMTLPQMWQHLVSAVKEGF